MVGKSEIMRKVWSDTFGEEANLTVNISSLRKVLKEDSHEQQFIETIPKRGYRFIAPVTELPDEIVDPIAKPHTQVETNFPIDETKRSGNVISLARWQREETENMVASDVNEEAEERRGDAETQHRAEREIAPQDLSKFLATAKQNTRLAFFVLASFGVVAIAG